MTIKTLADCVAILEIPAATDSGDGFEATWSQQVGAREAAIHSPVKQVHMFWIELQQQDDHLTP